MDFPALKDTASFRRCAYCKSKVACMSKGKCLLKKEAREFSETYDANDGILGRLIELNKKLEFAKPPKPLSGDERSRFDRRRKAKFAPADVTKAPLEKQGPQLPKKPKPTDYANKLLDAKKEREAIKEAKSKGRKRDRPKKVSPLHGKKKGESGKRKQADAKKRGTAVGGSNPALKRKEQVEVENTKPQRGTRNSRVTGATSAPLRPGAKPGRVHGKEKLNIPELDPSKKVKTLSKDAQRELGRRLRSRMDNAGVKRGLGRSIKIVQGMRIGTVLKSLGMTAAQLARFLK